MSPSIQRRLGYRFRRTVGPMIDRVARRVGHPMTRVRASEYAGTAHCPIEDFEAELADAGFDWDPVSLYHFTPIGTPTDGSWVYRRSPLADRQLHLVLFAQQRDRVDLYAHEEYNWVRHPIKHARQEDIEHAAGGRRMRAILDGLDVRTSHEPVVVRKLVHAVQRLRTSTTRPVRLPSLPI